MGKHTAHVPFAVIRNNVVATVHQSKEDASKAAEYRNGKVFSWNTKEIKGVQPEAKEAAE